MKLIDILNKIANRELKEGTKINLEGNYWDLSRILENLNEEVELIEPQEPKECEHEWEEYGMYNTETN